MSHPIDETARTYTKALDDLREIDRQLLNYQKLLEQKAQVEARLEALRTKMTAQLPTTQIVANVEYSKADFPTIESSPVESTPNE